MIETSLNTWLRANIALVAQRVYPRKLPQNPTLPALTYFEVSGNRWRSPQGPSGARQGRYQISCWAEQRADTGDKYGDAKTVADEVIRDLDCFTGLMGTTTIQACFYLNQVDLGNDEAGFHQIALDFYITYEE